MLQILIYPGENGYFVAEVPSLPGCISRCRTKEEAIVNIQEAVLGFFESLETHNQPIPEQYIK